MKNFLIKFLIIYLLSSFSALAKVSNEVKVHEVQTVGRSVIIDNNLKKARKLALEDALYLAALRGGAIVEGFSSVSNSTIINDQSIVKPTSNVLDFKILDESQTKEHFQIKILAVVGINQIKSKCKPRPLNITVFKGSKFADYSLPSNILRSMHRWYEGFYKLIKSEKNIKIFDRKDTDLKSIIKSSTNADYDYNAITNGLPDIKEGNFSLVPRFELNSFDLKNTFENQEKTAMYRVYLDFYKGSNYEFYKQIILEQEIPYEYKSKFQFVRSTFSRSLEEINNLVKTKTMLTLKKIINDFNCTPLEGVIKTKKDELIVNLGQDQGLYNRQIGIVKSNYNNSFLRRSENIVLYVTDVRGNFSKVVPLNDEIEISKLNNMKIHFVE